VWVHCLKRTFSFLSGEATLDRPTGRWRPRIKAGPGGGARPRQVRDEPGGRPGAG
jgi:hypothetical protein